MVQAWSGREVRALRESQRLSIREFAQRIGVSERMVSRWEAGGTNIRPRPINQEGLDTLLAAASEDERSRFAARLETFSSPGPRSESEAIRTGPTPPPSADLRLQQHATTAVSPKRTDGPDVLAMQAFRSADRQVGGGHLYAAVVKYLHPQVGPRLFGGDVVEDPAVFTAAAGLTEMAGWMAHDAGRDDRAYSHFLRAFHLSKAGQDRQLGVHVLASLSHLAHHRVDPHGAIRFAQAGEAALAEGPRNPELAARLLAMRARGRAALGDDQETRGLLGQAEAALGGPQAETPSDWVSHFDRGSLASEAARCMQQLGKPAEAQKHAQLILKLRPSNRTRSHAFGQLFLITSLIEQGEAEEACRVTRDIIESTQSLGSQLVVQRLREIYDQLSPYADSATVSETSQLLADTLRQRVWLQQWIASDAFEGQTTPR
ncbi:helix-turn-helix protein [Kribbella sp. VKM Ac-2571]|uniref:helix-turn-helix domain-containing protein n=1 Tax=Kribbella sp. VKM Ac-2571 TaxID=2512222 RepID=UPI0010DA3614|nr:helix-turn-helix transcriptional regulator [Kribbella sp. VKM Ac-2571]TDO55571.1 helix-turn-helix protein [Kribbella sp. VKM Ac-2571]